MVTQQRETWKGRIDFLLACMGFCIGLGNIWRFPYLCFFHGGAAFLLPYIIMTLILGLPLFFMELALGQFTSQGPVTSWGMNPMLSGIGWGMVLISTMTCIYYNVIVMYSFMYICLSFVNIGWAVPWASCDNDWNTPICRDKPLIKLDGINDVAEKITASLSMKNNSCVDIVKSKLGYSPGEQLTSIYRNYTEFENKFSACDIKFSLPSQEYWSRFILEVSDDQDISSVGAVVGRNTLFLVLTWVMIFLCLLRGPQSIAKVVYFSATYPLVILIVLLIRSITTPGYQDGITFYLVPEWGKLLDPEVWSAAASQVLFSLGICYGGLVALASYNNFKNNIFRDAMIVASVNMCTSIFGGFVTFSLIGSIAHETNRPMKDLVQSGPDLLFVVYPLGLANLPSPAIWAFLFFLMVFTLGLDSQFAMMETVVVGITDRFPLLGKHRVKFVAACCLFCFIIGLPLTTKGCGIEQMIGERSQYFWRYWTVMWMVVTPVMLLFSFIMAMVSYSPAEYEDMVIPGWAEFFGWMMTLGPVFCVIGGAVNVLLLKKIPILKAIKPTEDWGPLDKEVTIDDYMSVTDVPNTQGVAMSPTNDYHNVHDSSGPEWRTRTADDYRTVREVPNPYTVAVIPNNDFHNSQDSSEPDGCTTNIEFVNTETHRETYLEPSMINKINDANASALSDSADTKDKVDNDSKSQNQGAASQPTRCPSGSSDQSANISGNDRKTLQGAVSQPTRCPLGSGDQAVNTELIV